MYLDHPFKDFPCLTLLNPMVIEQWRRYIRQRLMCHEPLYSAGQNRMRLATYLHVLCELKSMCLQVFFKSGESTSGILSSPSNRLL